MVGGDLVSSPGEAPLQKKRSKSGGGGRKGTLGVSDVIVFKKALSLLRLSDT